jgi:integrase
VDIKTIQDQLGHASVVLTADTYTSVLPATHFRAPKATARLIAAYSLVSPDITERDGDERADV